MELETERSERSVRVRPEEEAAGHGTTSRLAALSGMIGILILDLLALDDITTAGEWVPEFAFLVASLPALLFLGHMALKRPRSAPELEEGRRARLERGAEVDGRDDREGVRPRRPGGYGTDTWDPGRRPG